MLQPGQSSRNSAAHNNPTSLSRRNLPRASHACQWCRAKKAKCDQQQPCLNCIKHSVNCEYGSRRRDGQSRTLRVQSQAREETIDRRDHVPSPASIHTVQDEFPGGELPEQSHRSAHSGFAHQTLHIQDMDVLGDVNQHTHGTEFYGTSSNFVLLNQFFAFAQQHIPSGDAGSSRRNEASYLSPSSLGGNEQPSYPSEVSLRATGGQALGPSRTSMPPERFSIINILSNEEALSPPSRPETPSRTLDKQQIGLGVTKNLSDRVGDGFRTGSIQHGSPTLATQGSQSGQATSHLPSLTHPVTSGGSIPVTSIRVAERRLEREYVRHFMDNLHHIHPMLDPTAFTARCEEQVWDLYIPQERKQHFKHFLALYHIVVAIGALIAGSSSAQYLERDIKLCMEHFKPPQNSKQSISSQALSKIYFRKSRELLGDVFEVCSLESAQTLLLMSLYCQNSHKPHACYMYCGHAVRTALAIGLTNESMSYTTEDRKAARRTWWCIYSHEIDMSCSSGRRDSLRKPHNYQIPLPLIGDQDMTVSSRAEVEDCSVAMVNEMVHFATILRRVSKELYHDSKGLTLLQKSMVAKELDGLLDGWKAHLPEWVNFSKVSFRGEEWAAKQKIVLHLRYLNARILIHRPFLVPPMIRGQLQMSTHVELGLEAARETIQVMYDAYTYRHYFRTWWYNSTYALYAGMIVLYVIILNHTSVSSKDLLNDVIKARDILQSMEEANVARRSADLIQEGLEAAQACVQSRQDTGVLPGDHCPDLHDGEIPPRVGVNNVPPNVEIDIPRNLFSFTGRGPDPGPLLESLINPNLLQDFTAGMDIMSDLDMSTISFDGYYGDGTNTDVTSMV